MAKSTKKRVSARAKTVSVAKSQPGLRRFHVIFSAEEIPEEVLARDEEDAAERACTKWEANLESVQVIDLDKNIHYLVSGKLHHDGWISDGVDVLPSETSAKPPSKNEHPSDPPPPPRPIPDFQCSFCGKRQREVKKLIAGPLIAGPTTVYICDECLVLSNEICLEAGIDVVKPAKENIDNDDKVLEGAKYMERARAAAHVLEGVVETLRTGTEDAVPTATQKLVDVVRSLDAEVFTKDDVISLLHLGEDARNAKVSIYNYVDLLKKRIALYERATRTGRGDWSAHLGMMAALAGMSTMAYMAGAKRAP